MRVEGEDRLAFFQRQTTNDVRLITPEHSLVTVLTSPAARILDVLRLLQDGESLEALTLPGHGAATGRYLKSRIFFMDKVRLTDLSDETCQVDLEGPAAAHCLEGLQVGGVPEMDQVICGEMNSFTVRAIGQRGLAGVGYRLVFPKDAQEEVIAALREKGAALLPESSYHVLRIEAGMPAAEAELTEEYTPLEAGLDWAVADNKGCYTGQEVIARQITYDKVTQQLAGLRLEVPAEPEWRAWVEGKPAGSITSAAISPRLGPVALGMLKRPYSQPGTAVQVGLSVEAATPALVSKLPF